MAGKYEKKAWVNEETPLNADNLNHIEEGIKQNSDDIAIISSDIIDIRENINNINANKLDALDTTVGESDSVVYAKSKGDYVGIPISQTEATKNTIVQRNDNGDVIIPTNQASAGDNVATSKYYVDDQVLQTKSTLNQKIVDTKTELNTAITTLENKVPILQDSKIPSKYLPSYVDDVVEGIYKKASDTFVAAVLGPGGVETQLEKRVGVIYVDANTNKTYRWTGSNFIEISPSLQLGTTSTTAYPGDKGLALEHEIAGLNSAIESLRGTDFNAIDFSSLQSITRVCNNLDNQIQEYGFMNGLNDTIVCGFTGDTKLRWTQDMYYRGKKIKGDERKAHDVEVPGTFKYLTVFDLLKFIGFHEEEGTRELMYGPPIGDNPDANELPLGINLNHSWLNLHTYECGEQSNIMDFNNFYPNGIKGSDPNEPTRMGRKLSLSINMELMGSYTDFMFRFIASRDFVYPNFAFNNIYTPKQLAFRLRRGLWKRFMKCTYMGRTTTSYDLDELEEYDCTASKWMSIYIRPYVNIDTNWSENWQLGKYAIKLSYIFIPINDDGTEFFAYYLDEGHKDVCYLKLCLHWEIVKID